MEVSCKEKILSNEYADWFVDFVITEETFKDKSEYPDYCLQEVDDDIGIVHVKNGDGRLLNLLSFDYQYLPEVYGLQWQKCKAKVTSDKEEQWENHKPLAIDGNSKQRKMNELHMTQENIFDPSPLIDSGIVKIQNAPFNLTGKGCILAFIDTGIDFANPVFLKSDGSSRILSIWDQSIQSGEPPEKFLYGSEYKREEINLALQAEKPYEIVESRDTVGHGTAMASVAAGSKLGQGSEFLGAAPDCDIVVVKLKECKPYLREYYLISEDVIAYQSTDIVMALKYIDQFAITFQRPVIYCLGIGSNFGGHIGAGRLSTYLEKVAKKRSRAVILCGGNEGNARHHYEGIFRGNQVGGSEIKETQEVEIRVGNEGLGFWLEIWGHIPNIFSISIRSPSGEVAKNISVDNNRTLEYSFLYEQTNIEVYYAITEQGSGDALIVIRMEKPTAGIWTIGVTNETGLTPATFHMWLPISEFISEETYFLKPTPDITLTVPSYVDDVIVSSTYNSYTDSFYVASGRGYARDGKIKPDICAPGVQISTSQKKIREQPLIETATGSSIAAAITAGVAAQLMQWAVVDGNATYIRSKEVKNYLIRGAKRQENIEYPNRLWGYGRLNIFQVFENIRRL